MRKDYNLLFQSYSHLETQKNKVEDEYQKIQQKYSRLEVYYDTLVKKLKKENFVLKQNNYEYEKRWDITINKIEAKNNL